MRLRRVRNERLDLRLDVGRDLCILIKDLLQHVRLIEEIDVVILRARELVKASVVLSLDEVLNDLVEVARVPSKRAPP